jgi:hypothetical protein
MAVLVEAISVITRVDSIVRLLPGGWEAFERLVPNATLCADEEIARVGFMSPVDVEAFTRKLTGFGLKYLGDGVAIDLAVADQIKGLLCSCLWLQFGRVEIGASRDRVAACRLVGSKVNRVITPLGWKFAGSLSSTYAFVPTEHAEKGVQYLRHEKGLDIYHNPLTGKECFVGRTGES